MRALREHLGLARRARRLNRVAAGSVVSAVRLVSGTLQLPEGARAFRLRDRYVDAGGRALDVANVYAGCA